MGNLLLSHPDPCYSCPSTVLSHPCLFHPRFPQCSLAWPCHLLPQLTMDTLTTHIHNQAPVAGALREGLWAEPLTTGNWHWWRGWAGRWRQVKGPENEWEAGAEPWGTLAVSTMKAELCQHRLEWESLKAGCGIGSCCNHPSLCDTGQGGSGGMENKCKRWWLGEELAVESVLGLCPGASCGSRGEDEAESKTSTKEPDETQDLGLKEKQR